MLFLQENQEVIRRVFVAKKETFDVNSALILNDFRDNFGLKTLKKMKIFQCYDVEGMSKEEFDTALENTFSEPFVDDVFSKIPQLSHHEFFGVQYIEGQFDQKADSAVQCIELLLGHRNFTIKTSRFYRINRDISDEDFEILKKYLINKTDSLERGIEKPSKFSTPQPLPHGILTLTEFNAASLQQLSKMKKEYGFSLHDEDLVFIQRYFRDTEKRDPTITELKVLDTYWSDHCRHTTFLTELNQVEIEDPVIKKTWESYLQERKNLGIEQQKPFPTLMDLATINVQKLRKSGGLENVDISKEVNACTLKIKAQPQDNSEEEDWLFMFKNETHNHPTEIEPYGGAATCIGGAIRDPLSGRSFVFQSMRVTGAADPRMPLSETLTGKLPQKKITTEAAHGFSSYGNQIGLATGQVVEIYHPKYVAKRMEVGAVIGAAPAKNVIREEPEKGDLVILLGGKTGKDGCGGASGSSKSHDETSIDTLNQEVQKGNPPEERKIQRLFKDEKVTQLIKRCNDFGAGGVSVAIGELADGVEIWLDKIPKKYDGLDGTELAISESQERMAVVVKKEDAETFIASAHEENIEATIVAEIKEDRRLTFLWRGKAIFDLSREFIDTNGITRQVSAKIPPEKTNYLSSKNQSLNKKNWKKNLSDLNVCSQRGLGEMFDNNVGGNTVLMPYGGKNQMTPQEGMSAILPAYQKRMKTAGVVAFSFDPYFSDESPYHAAMYAVIHSLTKIVCLGAEYSDVRFSFQEYFEKLGNNPEKWGKPLSALLGAYKTLNAFKTAAIGGKDSMSGTFNEIDVPPTLISFAFTTTDYQRVVSSEFKSANHQVYLLKHKRKGELEPDFEQLKENFDFYLNHAKKGNIKSAKTVSVGGIASAISQMTFGNDIGFEFSNAEVDFFNASYGSIIFETTQTFEETKTLICLGKTKAETKISLPDFSVSISELIECWESPLKSIFTFSPQKNTDSSAEIQLQNYKTVYRTKNKVAKPKVLIPVFPGTNSEYESGYAFEKHGAEVEHFVFNNLSPERAKESLKVLSQKISQSQILFFVGGFSMGDEPDGSAKYLSAIVRNDIIKDSMYRFLDTNDGLILGVCNGFQMLVKSGLLPSGKILPPSEIEYTLGFNKIGRHVAQMVHTKVIHNNSPWFIGSKAGDTHTLPVSHSEGRFMASETAIQKLIYEQQIATQYCDNQGKIESSFPTNPNGSAMNIEGIISPDGKIFGKMGHPERASKSIPKNIEVFEQQSPLFKSGVMYFK